MRIKAVIAYDGSRFYGFQKQPRLPTVAFFIEKALRTLGIDSNVVGSGRTDRGVHASKQVIHFDVPPYWNDTTKLKTHLNHKLRDIRILKLEATREDFHARYDAVARQYRYVFKTTRPHVFEERYISYYPPFDKKALKNALCIFKGTYDFKGFCKEGSMPSSTVRTVYQAFYYRYKHYDIITFKANAFLRSQVRLMTEAAMQVALGNLDLDHIREQLANRHFYVRKPASPNGLYLTGVHYPIEKR